MLIIIIFTLVKIFNKLVPVEKRIEFRKPETFSANVMLKVKSKKYAKEKELLANIIAEKKYDLRQSIENSIDNVKENYKKEIIFENNVSEDSYLLANEYLENAFNNILKNAIEYSDEPVKIKIDSEPEEGYIKITIEDQGRGKRTC